MVPVTTAISANIFFVTTREYFWGLTSVWPQLTEGSSKKAPQSTKTQKVGAEMNLGGGEVLKSVNHHLAVVFKSGYANKRKQIFLYLQGNFKLW